MNKNYERDICYDCTCYFCKTHICDLNFDKTTCLHPNCERNNTPTRELKMNENIDCVEKTLLSIKKCKKGVEAKLDVQTPKEMLMCLDAMNNIAIVIKNNLKKHNIPTTD